jgi:hypothetical protein
MQQQAMTEVDVQAALAQGLSVFEQMGLEGDIKSLWSPDNADEVEEARRQFERLTKEKKFRAYKVTGTNGERGEPMDRFEASQGRVIFVPALVGG